MSEVYHFVDADDCSDIDCFARHGRRPVDPFAIYQQAEVWVDREGNRHRIEDIDDRYASNIIRFLERRAFNLALAYVSNFWSGPFAPRGDAACDAVEQVEREILADPMTWLHDLPLVRALKERVQE